MLSVTKKLDSALSMTAKIQKIRLGYIVFTTK